MSKIYILNGREVRDFNGVPHDAKTGAPINAATGQTLSTAEFNNNLNIPPRRPASALGGARYRDSPLNTGGRSGPLPTPAPAPTPTPSPAPPASPAPSAPAPSTGRDTPPPDGSDAKGTNTGFKISLDDANNLLAGLKIRPMATANSFFSEQLPVSASEKPVQPGESVAMNDNEFSLAIQRPENDKYREGFDWGKDSSVAALRSYVKGRGFDDEIVVEGASVAGQTQKVSGSPVGTADNNRAISVPGEKPAGKPKKIRGAVDSRFDDGAEYGESYAVQYDSPEQEKFSMARNAAFLDPKNKGYAAVRAADAATGRFRQGDGYFYNTDDGLVQVDESTWDAGRYAPQSAQQLLKGKVEDIKQTLIPVDTPDATSTQSPGSNKNYDSDGFSVDDAVSGGMSQSDAETIGSGGQVETVFTPGGGQEREFDYNNGQPTKSDTYFGQKEKGIQAMKERFFKK